MRLVPLLLALATLVTASAAPRPNILLILADDLGYSDLGCYGGEIATPNLDRLAANGLRFTQFYNTARCWPTRSSLLTGYYAQQIRRDTVPGMKNTGGRGTRQPWAKLLPHYLRPLGYRSYHSGKWHLDGKTLAGGFDHSYHLKDQGRFFSPKAHLEDDQPLPPVPRGTGFYGTTAIADHAIKVLKEHAARHRDRPFFHYLAFTAPHFPLHAPAADIAKYKGAYQVGWDQIRARRWQRIRDSKLLDGELSAVERDLGPPYDFPDAIRQLGPGEINRPVPWNDLTDVQKAFQADKMAIHAAMIDRMDVEIGRVLDQVKAMGAADNTLVLFLSDNGASAEIMVRSDGHDPAAAPGSAGSYLCLGPGWSTCSNTPFRRHKTWTHEGGISTPLIVHWPKGISARGEIRRTPGHVIDIFPTILAITGGRTPDTHEGTDIPERPGKSLAPLIAKDGTVRHDSFWWLHDGHRAIRIGSWKAVSPKARPWELYDLSTDRAESTNFAKRNPSKLAELTRAWGAQMDQYRTHARMDLPGGRPKQP